MSENIVTVATAIKTHANELYDLTSEKISEVEPEEFKTEAEPDFLPEGTRRSNRKVQIPQFSYPGGKAKLAKRIVALLPAIGKRYVEVFAGRANLYFAVAQRLNYEEFWLNDIATYHFLVGLWAYGARAALGLGTVPERNGRAAHDRMRSFNFEVALQNYVCDNPVRKQLLNRLWKQHPDLRERAINTPAAPAPILEPFLVRDGNRYGKAGVRGEIGGGVSRTTYEHYLKIASDIMMRTRPHITWVDYREVLKECGSNDVVYLDPPYVKYGRKTGAYSETLNHREMVEILLNAPYRWALSEYENEIYEPLTKKFGQPVRVIVRKTMNNSNHHGGKRPQAVECIWRNF
jgi:site-specific DNA-adenine methylase